MTELTVDLREIIDRDRATLLEEWVGEQLDAESRRADLIGEDEVRTQSDQFLTAIYHAAGDELKPADDAAWEPVRDQVVALARQRAEQGFSPTETATFIFSLKQPLFARLEHEPNAVLWQINKVLDSLGLIASEEYLRSRESLIRRQQQELLELSTPVVKLWDGVLALPLIGTLDSERTQVVMESLLTGIVESGAALAIIDITGVPTVDTLVAQHLMKTVSAARLMGADCIISGIRPQIAQTIVQLGISLENVTTKATLADAVATALDRSGLEITQRDS